MPKKLKQVRIVWRDAAGDGGWLSLEEAKGTCALRVITTGFLYDETEHEYKVAMSVGENGALHHCICIPKGWIESFRDMGHKCAVPYEECHCV